VTYLTEKVVLIVEKARAAAPLCSLTISTTTDSRETVGI
jgi:hypothetical protein